MISFPSVLGVDTSINQKIITMNPHHFISVLLYPNFDFDVGVDNDLAKCALPGKVMQGPPCLKVHTLTNEIGRFTMKLNDNKEIFKFVYHDLDL